MTEILVVDDEPSVRLLLRDVLEMEGYDVSEAPDGPSAMRAMADHRPACVVLDVMMPGMSGIEVLTLIRANDELVDLPVMMLTAASDEETTWSGWSNGANYYLPKPFDVEHLLKWIDLLVVGPAEFDPLDDVDLVLTPVDPMPVDLDRAGAALFRLALTEAGLNTVNTAVEPLRPNPVTVAPTIVIPPAVTAVPDPGVWQEDGEAPLGEELVRALRTDQIWVAYQPIVALDGEALIGVEALARWRHPQRGDLSPSEFLPVAEKAGLGDELGRKILTTAARQIVAWNNKRAAIGLPSLLLSVNVSRRQITEARFLPQILDQLSDCELAPQLLVLEVGEPSLAALSEDDLACVATVTAAGVRLSLDDFGSADRSLESLRGSPVSFVKVDRSFVRGIGENASDDDAVRRIVSMAHRFGRIAVAEGVETRHQARWLLHLGCEYGQGYLFAYPAPAAHITEMVLEDAGRELRSGSTTPALDPKACDTSDDSARLDRLDRALPHGPTRR